MKPQRLLFIDRDGTLIEEPADEQIDSFDKLKFVKGALGNLSFICSRLDFRLVMVSNQDGLGTDSFPEETFWPVHNFIMKTMEGEGIVFDEQLIDRHFPEDNSPMRKPGTGMLAKYMHNPEYDLGNSYVIGDRDTDRMLAENLGCKALILGNNGITWDKIAEILFAGEILYENGRLGRADYLNYYLAMINDGYEENARNFYNEISLNLNDYEKALFAVQSKRSSDIIVSSLETLYSSDSLSERFIALMKEAIPLLISRGDQEMLLNLISYGTASDPSYCLYIGDLYFSLGNLEMASLYWNSAAEVFPIQVDLRTRTL